VGVVEIIDLYAVLAVLGTISTLAMIGLFRLKPTKTAQKAGSDGVKEMYSVYNDQVKDVLKIKDGQIQRLMAKIRELTPENDQVQESRPIELPALEKLAIDRGINPKILKNPLIMKYIKKYTKGMDITEILEIADSFGFIKGNKQSESETSKPLVHNADYF